MTQRIKNIFRNGIAALLIFVAAPALAELTISTAEWPEIRTASRILALPAIQQAVAEIEAAADRTIVIYFPGGDHGEHWAQELRQWLIVLGIKGEKIQLAPGSGMISALLLKTERS